MAFIVAIDGPAGSGKSSVAKAVANGLGFAYVDTGAIYRAVALIVLDRQMPQDPAALAKIARSLNIQFLPTANGQKVLLNDIDVSKAIRTERISKYSSIVSRYAEVRSGLLDLQRRLGLQSTTGAVLEGRDIGTVVFPDANIKFFLTASDEQRAQRRFLELQERGEAAEFEDVLSEIKERDQRDEGRDVAPLTPAADAIVVDTTKYSKQEVIKMIETKVKEAYQK